MFWFVMSILSAIIMVLVVWANTGALAEANRSDKEEVFSEYEKMLGLEETVRKKPEDDVV